MSKRQSTIVGIIWSAIERFAVQGIQFIVSIILARILTPQDFGVIAIVLIFLQIFQTLNESGFNTALVYKQDRDNLDYSTAFVANIIIGVVSYGILYVLSPYVAEFYNNKHLVEIMRLLSLNVIINSFGLVPLVKFTVNIDFKSLAKASLVAAVVSGIIGILTAMYLKNAYALVIQSLCYASVNVIAMSLIIRWKPIFRFSMNRFKGLFYYAYKLIGARIINVVFEDIYSLAIGKLYTPATLGCYNRSMSFRQFLSKNIINIVQRVSNPLLCEKQNNLQEMERILLNFISSTALIVYPLLLGLMVLSEPLVLVLLGEKWRLVSEMLILGCPCGFFYLISTFNRNIYNATGRTDLALKAEILKKIFFIFIFLVTMKLGIKVLLIGLIVISIIEMIIDIHFAKKQIGISFRNEFKSVIGILLTSCIMSLGISLILVMSISNILKLILGTTVGIVIYCLTCYIFNVADFKIRIKQYAKIFK